MPVEIERKFLVKNEKWKNSVKRRFSIKQGYLSLDPERVVRIRLKDQKGFLTIKGRSEGITRVEFEYKIPLEEAKQMLLLCKQPMIEKVRHEIFYKGKLWELDEFEGANKGLVLAEIELNNENDFFLLPNWVGVEVSKDPSYYNLALATHPYTKWK